MNLTVPIDGDVNTRKGSQLSTSSIMMENSIASSYNWVGAVGLTLTGAECCNI